MIPPEPWRVLLVDDEPLARQRLRKLLTEAVALQEGLPGLVIGEAGDAGAARARLAEGHWDLLLLDVRLPGLDGLALARELREDARRQGREPTALVFVTAHADHALEAFEVAAVDYLTKPVRRDRLAEALQRLGARRGGRPGAAGSAAATPPATRPGAPGADAEADEPVVVVQDRGRVVRVPASEIVWLKAELKYVTLRTAQASWLVDESLAELEGRLGRRFLRVHRNALVAVAALRRLEKRSAEAAPGSGVPGPVGPGEGGEGPGGELWAVQVQPTGEWLAVSRRQVAAVRACLARQPEDLG